MLAISSELTPNYHDVINKIHPQNGEQRSWQRRAFSQDRKTHFAGDRFRITTMAVSMKSMI
jgi:hypothetical protein